MHPYNAISLMEKVIKLIKNSYSVQYFFSFIFKKLTKKIGYPNFSSYANTNLRKILNIRKILKRKAIAKEIIKNHKGPFISKSEGYLLFGKNYKPTISNLIDACNKIIDKKGRENLNNWYLEKSKLKSKDFFFNVLEEDDVLDNPELMNFVLSDEILGCAIKYYGFVPQLSSLGLFVSPENQSLEKLRASQQYHLDGENQHLKCYVYLSDVTTKSGAFTFIPKNKSNELRDMNGGYFRSCGLENEQLLKEYDKNHSIQILGGPGNGGFVDTTSCLHYGSRCTEGDRLVFMFHYAAFANYTELPNNPLRDLRLQHYSSIRSQYSDTDLKKIVLSVG